MFEWLIPSLAFLAVFLFAVEAQKYQREARVRRRALALAQSATAAAPLQKKSSPGQEYFFQFLHQLAALQSAWISPAWSLTIEKKLSLISPWQNQKPAAWLAAKEVSLLAGGCVGGLLGWGWLSLVIAVAGFFIPDLWLKEKIRERQRGILRELPDTLDLLGSCMEAGLGFEQATSVIVERGHKGYLWEELNELLRMIRMGRSRGDALKHMASRVDDPDFNSFVTALIQAERLGVSVAATLKMQSSQLRTKRSQLIEKSALEAPVKLLFPLIVFIFPVVFLILFGPIIIRFMQGF